MKNILSIGKLMVIFCISVLIILTFIIFSRNNQNNHQNEIIAKKNDIEFSSWLVDWKWKTSLKDFEYLGDSLSNLQVFAVYFDSKGNLYFTDEMNDAIPKVFNTGFENVDITFVNDRMNEDGTSIQKDPNLVTDLMATEESRDKHIEQILQVVERYNFHGVEIDYERILDSDLENVNLFYRDLYKKLRDEGKTLRIVLESRVPIEQLSLPKGPVYVMMAYNLYGTHSGPGPKSDVAFITKLAKRMKQLPGENEMALAVGGFDWSDDGSVKGITEKIAVDLAEEYGVEVKRDKNSGSLYYTYRDQKNSEHTVWYADSRTLKKWIKTVEQSGFKKIGIWRLGEIERDTLEVISE